MDFPIFLSRYYRKFVSEHLCPWGILFEKILTPAQTWQAFCMGDGFGKMTPEQLANVNSGYDWSHVRDSSDDAIKAIADFIAKEGNWALSVEENARATWNILNSGAGLAHEEYLKG